MLWNCPLLACHIGARLLNIGAKLLRPRRRRLLDLRRRFPHRGCLFNQNRRHRGLLLLALVLLPPPRRGPLWRPWWGGALLLLQPRRGPLWRRWLAALTWWGAPAHDAEEEVERALLVQGGGIIRIGADIPDELELSVALTCMAL